MWGISPQKIVPCLGWCHINDPCSKDLQDRSVERWEFFKCFFAFVKYEENYSKKNDEWISPFKAMVHWWFLLVVVVTLLLCESASGVLLIPTTSAEQFIGRHPCYFLKRVVSTSQSLVERYQQPGNVTGSRRSICSPCGINLGHFGAVLEFSCSLYWYCPLRNGRPY